MNATSGEITDFLGDLKCLAIKADPKVLNLLPDHLAVCEFSDRIHNSQVKLVFKNRFVGAELTIETVLEKTLGLKAVTY